MLGKHCDSGDCGYVEDFGRCNGICRRTRDCCVLAAIRVLIYDHGHSAKKSIWTRVHKKVAQHAVFLRFGRLECLALIANLIVGAIDLGIEFS